MKTKNLTETTTEMKMDVAIEANSINLEIAHDIANEAVDSLNAANSTHSVDELINEVSDETNLTDVSNLDEGFINYEIHPVLKKFPEAQQDEQDALEEDIRSTKTLINPIVIYDKKIIDGRLRQKFCKKHHVRPHYKIIEDNVENVIELIESLNLHRSEKTKSQRAILAYENRERFFKKNITNQYDKIILGDDTPEGHSTRKLVCAYYCIAEGMYGKAKNLKEIIDKKENRFLYDFVKSGKINLDLAKYLTDFELIEADVLMLAKYELTNAQIKTLITLKKDDSEYYQKILSNHDEDKIKRCLDVSRFVQHPEIYSKLKADESYSISEATDARMEKNKLLKKDKENELTTIKIKKGVQSKLNDLMATTELPLDDLLEKMIAKFEDKR